MTKDFIMKFSYRFHTLITGASDLILTKVKVKEVMSLSKAEDPVSADYTSPEGQRTATTQSWTPLPET